MQNKIIIKIDASAIAKSACMLHLYRTVIEGYRGVKTNINLEYGSAFHLFEKTLFRCPPAQKDFAPALAIGAAQKYFQTLHESGQMEIGDRKHWMSVSHLTKTCMKYIEEFGVQGEKDNIERLVHNGECLVERRVSIPWYVDDRIEVLLQGTMDKLVKFKNNGPYAIGDNKTTSSWNVDDYFLSYYMKPQLKFYRLIVEWLAQNFPDSIYATMLNKGGRIGCFIDGVFISASKDTIFKRSPVMFFSSEEMDEFKTLLNYNIQRLVQDVRNGTTPLREGMLNEACEGNWGYRCPFFASCSAPDYVAQTAILKHQFKQKPYDPLTHGEPPKTNE